MVPWVVNPRLHSRRPVPQASSLRPRRQVLLTHRCTQRASGSHLVHLSLQICSFIFNNFQNPSPATPFLSNFCVVARGCVPLAGGIFPENPEKAIRPKRRRGEKGTGARGAPIPVVGHYRRSSALSLARYRHIRMKGV